MYKRSRTDVIGDYARRYRPLVTPHSTVSHRSKLKKKT